MTDDREELYLALYDVFAADLDARFSGAWGFEVVHDGIRSFVDVVRQRGTPRLRIRLVVLDGVPDEDLEQMIMVLASGIRDTSLESLTVERRDPGDGGPGSSQVTLRGVLADVPSVLAVVRGAPGVLGTLAEFYPELGLHVARH